MAKKFREIYQATAAAIRAQADAAILSNRTGLGDGREEIVRKLLREHVGNSFGVAKAEIIDSTGQTSAEHDVVIFDQDVSACVHAQGDRQVVTVESVAMIVEVKTTLDGRPETIAKERARFDALGRLRRFYRLAPIVAATYPTNPRRHEIDAFLSDGLGAREYNGGEAEPSGRNVQSIPIGYFAFQGWRDEEKTLAFAASLGLDIVCALEGASVWRLMSGQLESVQADADALAMFLTYVRHILQLHRDSRSLVTPDAWRYLMAAVMLG